MQRFRIEMMVSDDLDPSTLLERAQELCCELARDLADDEDGNNIMLDGAELDTDALTDDVSVEPIGLKRPDLNPMLDRHRIKITVSDHTLNGKTYPEISHVSILKPVFPREEHTSWCSNGITIDNKDLPQLIGALTERAAK